MLLYMNVIYVDYNGDFILINDVVIYECYIHRL